MPFRYGTKGMTLNIDEAGTNMVSASFTPRATLGTYLQSTFTIDAVGFDAAGNPQTVFNLMFSFRFSIFTQEGTVTSAAPGQGFRLLTGNAIAAPVPMTFQSSSSQNAPNTNGSATLEVISSTKVRIIFRFYCTSSDPNFAPFFINSQNRLLASDNTGAYMTLAPGSQYGLTTSGISIKTLVSQFPETIPPSPAYQAVTFGGGVEYYIPVFPRWLGRNLGNTDFVWILSQFKNTTSGGNIIADKIHKPTAQPHQALYDDNFIEASASLSALEDNYLYFNFLKANGASASMTSVRVIVMRVDSISGYEPFLLDYESSIANLPLSDTGNGQVSGAIHAPCSVVNTGSAQCEVSFRIPAAHVVSGARYRVLVVLYSTGTSDVYSGVTHELTADNHPNFYPEATVLNADYFAESALPRGMMSYHSAYRSRILIQKASLSAAFAYYGLTGSFNNVSYVRADVVKPGTETPTGLTPDVGANNFYWKRGEGLLRGRDLVDTEDVLGGAFIGYIDEEWAARAGSVDALYYVSIMWEIGISSTLPSGESVVLKCQYPQKIDARRWESEAGQPSSPPFTLTMQLYRLDGVTLIPDGTQYVCGADEIKALVEKIDVLSTGTLDAYFIPETYGEVDTDGNTAQSAIKQRHGAFMGYIPASTNTAINAYDAQFSLNAVMGTTIDDAGARIDIRDLGSAQKFWLVGIARKIWPNGVPFIGDTVAVEVTRASDVSTITADFTDWWLAFNAVLGSSVSPFNFRIVNHVTQNFAGITDGAFGNPSTDDTQIEVTVDHELFPQLLNFDVIYEIEGLTDVSGVDHLVRFMVRKSFAIPAADGSASYTIDPADWHAVDFDY